jgi:hypothetical protein
MGKEPPLLLNLIIILALIHVITSFTLSFPNGTACTDYYTLTPAVTYTMNITFSPTNIPSNSYLTIQFGYRYNITPSTLTNCQFSTNAASYSSTNCTVAPSGSSTATIYVITFPNVYPIGLTSQSSMNLIVQLPPFSSPSPTPGVEAQTQHKI